MLEIRLHLLVGVGHLGYSFITWLKSLGKAWNINYLSKKIIINLFLIIFIDFMVTDNFHFMVNLSRKITLQLSIQNFKFSSWWD
jgi:hypothetical protein